MIKSFVIHEKEEINENTQFIENMGFVIVFLCGVDCRVSVYCKTSFKLIHTVQEILKNCKNQFCVKHAYFPI